jgi:hypothetical protein
LDYLIAALDGTDGHNTFVVGIAKDKTTVNEALLIPSRLELHVKLAA